MFFIDTNSVVQKMPGIALTCAFFISLSVEFKFNGHAIRSMCKGSICIYIVCNPYKNTVDYMFTPQHA